MQVSIWCLTFISTADTFRELEGQNISKQCSLILSAGFWDQNQGHDDYETSRVKILLHGSHLRYVGDVFLSAGTISFSEADLFLGTLSPTSPEWGWL